MSSPAGPGKVSKAGVMGTGRLPDRGELRRRISEIRRRGLQARERPRMSLWTRKDRMFYGPGRVSYGILDTGGCRWARDSGGCSMCGFSSDSCSRRVTPEEIREQVELLISKISGAGEPFGLRIFTSGSFFDDREIGVESRKKMLERLSGVGDLSEFTVESRPEHVSREGIENLVGALPGVETEVAIGLETTDDTIRDRCIGKGFSFEDFARASKIIRQNGSRCKAYILLKPPFISEFDAAHDSVRSMKKAAGMVDALSLNACNVQRTTLVQEMQRSGYYRPPWIWTVREVLLEAQGDLGGAVDIICDTVAFGTRRGPHNCRRCDKRARAMISRYSLFQDPSALEGLECGCVADWEREFYYHF